MRRLVPAERYAEVQAEAQAVAAVTPMTPMTPMSVVLGERRNACCACKSQQGNQSDSANHAARYRVGKGIGVTDC